MTEQAPPWTAFEGHRRLSTGSPQQVALAVAGAAGPVLVFDDLTARVVDLDLRGSAEEIAARYAEPARGRGRPPLGVTAREVTLLPRHWDWLATQRGGASATLRRLVEEARRAEGSVADRRARQDVGYRFMAAMAGDLPNYEEAIRTLYASDRDRFEALTDAWPADIRDHARRLCWAEMAETG